MQALPAGDSPLECGHCPLAINTEKTEKHKKRNMNEPLINQMGLTEISDTVSLMNEVMNEFHCGRRFGDDVISGNWETFDDNDYEKISKCGYRLG